MKYAEIAAAFSYGAINGPPTPKRPKPTPAEIARALDHVEAFRAGKVALIEPLADVVLDWHAGGGYYCPHCIPSMEPQP